jgi:hypothetical protein
MRYLIYIICCCTFVFAGQKAPLPDGIVSAQSVYIDNQSGVAELADRAYDELKKWGRFEIVSSPTKADLIFTFTISSEPLGYESRTNASIYGSTAESTTTTQETTTNYTNLAIVDAKTKETLWRNSKSWGFRSATRSMIRDLKDRLPKN